MIKEVAGGGTRARSGWTQIEPHAAQHLPLNLVTTIAALVPSPYPFWPECGSCGDVKGSWQPLDLSLLVIACLLLVSTSSYVKWIPASLPRCRMLVIERMKMVMMARMEV